MNMLKLTCSGVALTAALAMAEPANTADTSTRALLQAYRPVTEEMLAKPDPADWLTWRRTEDNWANSPLGQITPQNIGQIQLAWGWQVGPGTFESTPQVHDGIMFLEGSRDVVYALNAANGDLIWKYTRELPKGAGDGNAGAKRSLTIYGDKVIITTADAHVVSLEAKTGKVDWETQVADWEKYHVSFTSGAIVADGVLVAATTECNRFRPDRSSCYILGLDPANGKELWRFYTNAINNEPGADTWNGIPNNLRAGSDAWVPCAYDRGQKIVLCATGQPYPWPRVTRSTGDSANLYSQSTLALDPHTGKLLWYHQYDPGDTLDLDEVYEHVLIDSNSQKRYYKIGKPGYLWVMDRTNGNYIDGKFMVYNTVFDMDKKTGQLMTKESAIPQDFKTPVRVCPSTAGGKDWHPMAFNPETRLLYMPLAQVCMNFTAQQVKTVLGTTGGGSGGFRTFAPMPNAKGQGKLSAVNVDTLQTAWEYEQHAPFLTGILSTSTGLIVVGDLDRYVKVFDAKTGKVLWQTRLSQSVQGMPTTYSVGDRQYIAVPVGLGGGSPRAQASQVPDIKIPDTGNALYVFALPDHTAAN
jgi:alcohol dehydrogenase (cytochrome c)